MTLQETVEHLRAKCAYYSVRAEIDQRGGSILVDLDPSLLDKPGINWLIKDVIDLCEPYPVRFTFATPGEIGGSRG